MKKLFTIGLVLFSFGCMAQNGDTVYVKQVYIGGHPVKVKSGYILNCHDGTFIVNGKMVTLYKVKPTNRPNYEPAQK